MVDVRSATCWVDSRGRIRRGVVVKKIELGGKKLLVVQGEKARGVECHD